MNGLPGWDRGTSPYHRGERELHDRLDRGERQDAIGRRVLRPYMPDQHREFFRQLPFLVLGSVDAEGWPWASMLFGRPGFAESPEPRRLEVRARPLRGDPLREYLADGMPAGVLGIELPTRRRNRMNGIVALDTDLDDARMDGARGDDARSDGVHRGFAIEVVQSFGNCPQYIQTRAPHWVREPEDEAADPVVEPLDRLDADAVRLIRNADTLFVASHNPDDDPRDTGGVDVNHRGGRSGFVLVEGNTLTVPEYVGNYMFNTLGNFLVCPKAGLLFVDFDSGDLLLLTGRVELLWEKTPEFEAFRGAERGWRFTLHRGVRLRGGSPLRWRFGELSPNVLQTGDWDEAAQRVAGEAGPQA